MKHIQTILEPALAKYTKRYHVLSILNFTMISSKILVKSGVFNDPSNAHKVLKVLKESEKIKFCKYAIPKINSFQHFYSLRNSKAKFHIIHKDNILHDTITAIFLIQIYRACFKRGIIMKWYPPFPIGNKYSDGGITLSKNDKLLRSILIETDTGTHSHAEIRKKFESYTQFIKHSHRKVLFLVPSKNRIQHLQETLKLFSKFNVFFFNPLSLKSDQDIFDVMRGS